MTVKINPKLLDAVQLSGAPFEAGEIRHGTIVELLGGTPEMALIEVSDEQGVPVTFVPRTVQEVVRIGEGIKQAEYKSNVPEAQLRFESGIFSLQNGWHERAKEQFFRSFSLDPKYRGALLNTTNELTAKAAFEPAIVVYTMLLELSPDYGLARENFAITQMNRAIAFAQHGLFPQAMEAFLKALALHPSSETIQAIHNNIVATYTQLGLFYSNANQYQLAFQSFQRAFEIDPSEISRKNLAVAMIAVSTASTRIRSIEVRAEMFRQPLLMGLTQSECLTAHGATLATLGEIAEAKRVFQAAVAADRLNEIARHDLEVLSARESNEGILPGFIAIENKPLAGSRF